MELELPSHLEVRDQGTSLEIVRRWSGWERIPFTLCAVAVDGFVLYWDTVMDNLGAIDTGGGKPMAVILSLLLTYIALIRWFNRTHIQIDRDKLTIQHKPLPYFGNKTVSASAITQCYAKQIVTTVGTDRGPVTYEVRARTRSGREMKLVGGLESAEQALFIEQAIERYLNIEDAPVKGEMEILGGKQRIQFRAEEGSSFAQVRKKQPAKKKR